jgi:hypothetical protein
MKGILYDFMLKMAVLSLVEISQEESQTGALLGVDPVFQAGCQWFLWTWGKGVSTMNIAGLIDNPASPVLSPARLSLCIETHA